MLATAIESEVSDWTEKHSHIVDDKGHRQVVRNGYLPERTIVTGWEMSRSSSLSSPQSSPRRAEEVHQRGVNELNFAHKCVTIK